MKKFEQENKNAVIFFENDFISIGFELEPRFRIVRFFDRKKQQEILTADSGLLYGDRSSFPIPVLESWEQVGKNQWKISYRSGVIRITRFLECYSDAAAVRWYDQFSTAEDISGMYYSDLVRIDLKINQEFRCRDFFSCSDQSNHRFLDKNAVAGKNRGGYFVSDLCWVYKEGPMPDCQPIKGEYDFLWDPEKNILSSVGLGFDNLRVGETRRANGVVIGLSSCYGMQRYRLDRYKDFPGSAATEVLSNSWPELEFGVTEEAISQELSAAAESGVNLVFIDDGWFSLFMGDIDEQKFPSKFDKLKEKAEKLGIELGLWMNPLGLDVRHPKMLLWDGAECHDTMLEKNPWNWAARTDDFMYCDMKGDCTASRSYAGIELLDPDCYDFRLKQIIRFAKDYHIRHFKFDLYQLSAFNTRLGDANIHYEKYRQLLSDLQQAVPELVISMDVTRRNRPNFDFALDYGRLFLENRGRNIPDHRYYHPYMALGNFWYTLNFAPARQMEIEMMPQAMDYPLDYILGTTVFGAPLYWGCVSKLCSERRLQMKDFFAKMEPLRKKFARNINLPAGDFPQLGSWSGILSIDPEEREFYLAVYRNGAEEDSHQFSFPFTCRPEVVYGKEAEVSETGKVSLPGKFAFALIHGCNGNDF